MSNFGIEGISIFLVSLILSLIFVYLARASALYFSILDTPDGKIKMQKKPVPYLGGIGVYGGFLFSVLLSGVSCEGLGLCFLGVSLLLLLGLFDDLVTLAPYQKFAGQLFVVICFLISGAHLKNHFFIHPINCVVSVFWVLTIVNGINLVDVMDGLATTIALFSTMSFIMAAVLFEQYTIAVLLFAFAGSLVGFLWYNRPNASIYLGDAGALFIGGVLSVVPFFITWGKYNTYGYLAPVLFLWAPLAEVGFLILIRSYKGIPFYRGSPDHFCHYLQRSGWSKYAVLLLVSFFSVIASLLAGLCALGLMSPSFYILCVSIMIFFWVFVVYGRYSIPF